jgi:hypothetical protein
MFVTCVTPGCVGPKRAAGASPGGEHLGYLICINSTLGNNSRCVGHLWSHLDDTAGDHGWVGVSDGLMRGVLPTSVWHS